MIFFYFSYIYQNRYIFDIYRNRTFANNYNGGTASNGKALALVTDAECDL